MKIDYTPIKMLKANENTFESIKQFLVSRYVPNAKTLEFDDLFYMLVKMDRNPITETLLEIMLRGMSTLDHTFIDKLEDGLNGRKNGMSADAELKDVFMLPLILEKWSKSKQIFKPDPDFADALLHTDKLCLSANMLNHIPYNLFYVDFTACKAFYPMDGAFVDIEIIDNRVYFNLYTVSNTMTYFSFYLTCEFDENNCINISQEVLNTKEVGYDVWKPLCLDPNEITDYKLSRVDINIFLIQLIAYLSIDEPQLTESDLTKNTYRKPSEYSTVKNKWSEVRIQDVGIKYGSDFRKTILELRNSDPSTTANSKRKSPVPHFRCAHWHKFWVGKGRKTLKVMWIEPIFVGNGEPSTAVIHKIKNT